MTLKIIMSLFTTEHLLLAIGGNIIGIIFGAIPGLSSSTALALLLPVSFAMTAETGIVFLGNVWIGGVSGGLIASILLGIPGSPSSIATCYDGYPMSQKGESVKALGIGILSSFIGTVGSALIAYKFCPVLAKLAIKLGPWELFSLCFCAIVLVVTISKGNMWNGLIAGCIGLLLSSVGYAPIDGAQRFDFGIISISGGINLLSLVLGVFALGHIMKNYGKGDMVNPDVHIDGIKGFGLSLKEYFSHTVLIIKSFIIGLWIGFLPGMGSGLSNMVAYASAKGSSKEPEKFGTGCVEGVIASEVSNNAAVGGAIIPMIALGIPGDTPTTLLLSGLIVHGIEAGPLLLTNSSTFVYTFFATVFFAAIITLLLQFFGMRSFPLILRIPYHFLFAAISAICFVGAFSNTNSLSNCWLMLVFVGVGLFFTYAEFPTSPMILAFILGTMLESNLRKGLTYSDKGFIEFLTRPISGLLLALAFISLFWPFVRDNVLAKRKAKAQANE